MNRLNSRPPSVLHALSLRDGLALIVSCVMSFFLLLPQVAYAQDASAAKVALETINTNDVVIELFYRSDSDQSLKAEQFLQELATRREGIKIKAYDVLKERAQTTRLWELSRKFGFETATVPSFHFCNHLKVGFHDAKTTGVQIEELLNIKAYVRPGCKHCQAGREFLDKLVVRWPALKVYYFDVVNDAEARATAERLITQHRVRVASFPCIEVAGRLFVGYQADEITGRRIEDLFLDRSVDIKRVESESPEEKQTTKTQTEKAKETGGDNEQSTDSDSHSSFNQQQCSQRIAGMFPSTPSGFFLRIF